MTSVIASDPRRWRDVLRKELIPAELRHLVKATAQTAALEAGVESVTHGWDCVLVLAPWIWKFCRNTFPGKHWEAMEI